MLKVYGHNANGILGGRQGTIRHIAAATSRRAAAAAMGVTDRYLRTYGAVSANEEERRAALSRPGVHLGRLWQDRDGESEVIR